MNCEHLYNGTSNLECLGHIYFEDNIHKVARAHGILLIMEVLNRRCHVQEQTLYSSNYLELHEPIVGGAFVQFHLLHCSRVLAHQLCLQKLIGLKLYFRPFRQVCIIYHLPDDLDCFCFVLFMVYWIADSSNVVASSVLGRKWSQLRVLGEH